MTTRHIMATLIVAVALSLTCPPHSAADQYAQARAPVAPPVPAETAAEAPSLERAYALEKAGKFDEAIAAYLDALLPAAPGQASFEAPLGVARLSEDAGRLRDALLAAEASAFGQPAGFALPRAILMAKLGLHTDLAPALQSALDEAQMAGGVPDAFLVLLRALIALAQTSPEATASALVGLFELVSPNADVCQRGLERIEGTLKENPASLTLRGVALWTNDAVGNKQRAQELEGLLRGAPLEAGPAAELAQLAIDSRGWDAQLQAELAALRQQGVPMTIGEVAPGPVPDAENAAVLYQRVFQVEFAGQDGPPWQPVAGQPYIREFNTAVMGPEGLRVDATTRELLAGPRAQEVLDTLRQASLLPHSVFPLRWEDGFSMLLPHMASFRASTRVVATYALLLAEDGRVDEALDWCLVALRMSGHAASEPTIIAQLVSAAVQAIAFRTLRDIVSEAPVSPAVAARYEEYLRGLSPHATFRASVVAERAAVCDIYTVLEGDLDKLYGILPLIGKGAPGFARLYCSPLARPLHKADQLSYLQYVQTALDTVDLPYRHAALVLTAMETEFGGAGGNVLAAALM
ncbi:MAG: hypothetical protein ACE5JM_15900, partial [Armatimonadota bacterium]